MQPIATDGVAWCVCMYVGLYVTSVCHSREPCKMDKPIEIPFGLWAWMGPRNYVLDEGPDLFHGKGQF